MASNPPVPALISIIAFAAMAALNYIPVHIALYSIIFLTLLLSNFGAIKFELDAIELSIKDVTRPYKAYSENIPFHPIIDDS